MNVVARTGHKARGRIQCHHEDRVVTFDADPVNQLAGSARLDNEVLEANAHSVPLIPLHRDFEARDVLVRIQQQRHLERGATRDLTQAQRYVGVYHRSATTLQSSGEEPQSRCRPAVDFEGPSRTRSTTNSVDNGKRGTVCREIRIVSEDDRRRTCHRSRHAAQLESRNVNVVARTGHKARGRIQCHHENRMVRLDSHLVNQLTGSARLDDEVFELNSDRSRAIPCHCNFETRNILVGVDPYRHFHGVAETFLGNTLRIDSYRCFHDIAEGDITSA